MNLSARQLGHELLVDEVAAVLASTGLEPADLTLELTESLAVGDSDAPLATIHALKALGLRIGLDDFGTGHSSLGNLQRIPVDVLKLGRTFVDGSTATRPARR